MHNDYFYWSFNQGLLEWMLQTINEKIVSNALGTLSNDDEVLKMIKKLMGNEMIAANLRAGEKES